MKRLSALLIGFIMIVGANSALALEGSTYNDPSMNAGITATQAWGHDKPAATNCSNMVIGLDEPSRSTDGHFGYQANKLAKKS